MIGVFGSAFNPPTKGHAFVIKEALKVFDKVIAVPSFDHCFGKNMASFDLRLDLAKALVADIGDKRVEVSDIEKEIWSGEPVSSLKVLMTLKAAFLDEDIQLIIGPDNAANFHKFRNHSFIRHMFGVYVAEDAGGQFPRSTEIRRRITASEPYNDAVTPGVAELMKENYHHFQGI